MQGASEAIMFSFVSVYSRATMFRINFQSVVVPEFTFCVYSNLSISSRAKQRHHTTLVVGVDSSLPQIAPVSPQWSLCARCACFIWVSTRLQSANHHPQTLHTRVIFFCLVPIANVSGYNMCTCDSKVIKCQIILHNDHNHHPISHTDTAKLW